MNEKRNERKNKTKTRKKKKEKKSEKKKKINNLIYKGYVHCFSLFQMYKHP